MRKIMIVLALGMTCLSGCLPTPAKTDFGNRIYIENKSQDAVLKVHIKWGKRTFRFDPSKAGDTEVTQMYKKIGINSDVDTEMAVEVYYAGSPEPVVHEGQPITLKIGEAKKVMIDILADQKISVSEKQGNPHIQ